MSNFRGLVRTISRAAVVSLFMATGIPAATFSTELLTTIKTAPEGNYLSAAFDFGTAFSNINYVSLELAMPAGFEGSALTTGNSSYFRELTWAVHESGSSLSAAELWDSQNLVNTTFAAPTSPWTVFMFTQDVFVFEGEAQVPAPPSFLLSGKGQVAFIDVFRSSFHPLPDRITLSSTTAWQPPAGIVGARLTIEGTPVPEPAMHLAVTAAIMLIIAGRFRLSPRML